MYIEHDTKTMKELTEIESVVYCWKTMYVLQLGAENMRKLLECEVLSDKL